MPLSNSNRLVKKISSFVRPHLLLLKSTLILTLTILVFWALEGSGSLDASHRLLKENALALKSAVQASQGHRHLNLRNGNDLPAVYTEAAGPGLALKQNSAKPLALASGDFDQDGIPDLLAGYQGTNGGILSLYRGNAEALYPAGPAAERKATDAPFLSPAKAFAVPVAPEFLAAGDFDGDGYLDVVATARETQALYLLAGDGQGQFSAVRRIELSGKVTAMAEMNQTLVAGVSRADGPKLLVFNSPEGLLKAEPETLSLPAEATTIAFGQLNEDNRTVLAVGAGQTLLIYDFAEELARTSSAHTIQLSFPSAITSIAIGRFTERGRTEIALLTADGAVQLVSRKKAGAEGWNAENFAPGSGAAAGRLVRGRISSNSTDDLILLDSTNHRLQILTDNVEDASLQQDVTTSLRARDAVSLDLEGEPVAVLPMRLNADALDDLVILRSDKSAPSTIITQAAMTFTVMNTNDSGIGSLRQAILDANANVGFLDTINFNIPGSAPHTIIPLSALPTITDPVTINGASQPDFSGFPVVELNGSSAGDTNGLTFSASAGGSNLRGLVINRFSRHGIELDGDGNIVEGNFIGTNATGTFAFGNAMDGVFINASSGNLIGGTTSAARNLISGNRNGIQISGAGVTNQVRGNFIGTNVTGASAIGNSVNGILINGSSNNAIGAIGSASTNTIAFNGGAGVAITSGTGNAILSNSIFLNGGLGIDLGPAGATPNDTGDPDTGANNLQNFPVITSASNVGVSTGVEGTLNSTPNTSFRLEFFANQVSNPSGFGEGQNFIGFLNIATDGTGNASFSQTFPVTVPPGQVITATATRNVAPLDTSEFSRAVQVGGVTGAGQPADLSVLATISPNPAQTGSSVTTTITVANAGPGTATNVTVTALLPATTTFVSCSATGGGVCGGTGSNRTITFASLAPGTTTIITIAARVNCNVPNGVPISATAVVFSSTTPDLNSVNNTSTATTLSSNPAPVITCQAEIRQPNDPGKCSAVVNFTPPIVVDSCLSTTVVCSPAPGSTFAIGTTRVTCTATNAGGATADCTFNVTVLDTEPVKITCPDNVVINAVPGQCSPVVNYQSPLVTDNCPGATVSCVPPAGSTFPIGTTVVNCIATDVSKSSQAICSFSVTVNGAPQAVVTLEGDGPALKFGPTSARGKPRKLKKQPARNFTIENTGCLPLVLTLNSILRTGSDVDRGRISNPDDRNLFSLKLVDAAGNETLLDILSDVRIAPGEKQKFRVRFNPIIPTVERDTRDLAADQVLPDLVTSRITFTQNAGPPIIINLVGQVDTSVQLIDPETPRHSPLIVFSRVDDEFVIEYSIYDSNLDVSTATYQLFDRQGRPAGKLLSASLSSLIQQSGFVKGQSFTIVQKLSGAQDHPEVVGVTVTVSDNESSASANSILASTAASSATVQLFQPAGYLKWYLPDLKFQPRRLVTPSGEKNDAPTEGAAWTQARKELNK